MKAFSPADESSITKAANAFENAWRAGLQPRIEDFLPEGDSPRNHSVRQTDFVELILIDLEYRRSKPGAVSGMIVAEASQAQFRG
ncbi:MAG: hypothetical protein AB7O38_26145 [Pirellulaceae bacterium]